MNWTQKSKVLVQGISDSLSLRHAARMRASGTDIVAGIEAGQGGQTVADIPVFDLVEEAISKLGQVETSLIFGEAYSVLDAALEAIAAGIKQIIIISRGVPPLDTVRLLKKAKDTDTLIVGPGSGGIIIPEKTWLGTSEPEFFRPGRVGMISRSDILSYEVALELKKAELGQSFAVSIGNEGIIGSSFEWWLQELETDQTTEAIVVIGKAGGIAEEAAAKYIAEAVKKPTVAYLAGLQAPIERPFIDAATIVATGLSYSVPVINQPRQTITAFEEANIPVAKRPAEVSRLVKEALSRSSRKSKVQ